MIALDHWSLFHLASLVSGVEPLKEVSGQTFLGIFDGHIICNLH